MKKLISIVLAIILLSLTLTGCVNVKHASRKFVGTYYFMENAEDYFGQTVEEKDNTAHIVLNEDGNGYYTLEKYGNVSFIWWSKGDTVTIDTKSSYEFYTLTTEKVQYDNQDYTFYKLLTNNNIVGQKGLSGYRMK